MPDTSFHHVSALGARRSRRHRPARLLAGIGVAALLAGAGALGGGSAAFGAATRDILLTELDSVVPVDALGVSPLLIDSGTQRGYAIDSVSSDLLVFDLAGGMITPITSVVLGPASAGLALDESSHEVVVSDPIGALLRVVDGDPSSPMVNTVVASYATGGGSSNSVAVDSVTHLAYVANVTTDDVSVIDLASGSRRIVPVGSEPNAIAVDPSTATAYVASAEDKVISTIVRITPSDTIPMALAPITLTYSVDRLLVGTESATAPYEYTIESYDSSMTRTETTGPLAGMPGSITVDPGLRLVYVTFGTSLVGLRLDTLQGETPGSLVTGLLDSATVDPVSHHVFTVTNTRARSTLTMYDVQASPLLAATTGATAQVGSPFSYVVEAVAQPAANQFTVTSGALPPGLVLDAVTGEIHGTPTADGSYTFAVTASNGFGTPGTGIIKITVSPATPFPPVITSGPPPGGTVNAPYSFTVTATGVPAPTFSVVGTLPPGLSLNPTTGVISGTPTTQGTSSFTITATNSLDDWSEEYTIVIAAADPVPTPTPTPSPTASTAPVQPAASGGSSGTPHALASTGADSSPVAGIALGVLVLGAALVLTRRLTVRTRS